MQFKNRIFQSQSFSERALMTDERERDHFPGPLARAGAHSKTNERERKIALIFCAHQLP